jgi:hypothetical protein
VASRRRKNKTHAPVHHTQHHPPHARGRGGTTPGGRQRASRRLHSVRTPRGWLEPARGEFLAPNSPLGPPPVLLVDFFPLGGAHQSAWSLYIILGHTMRRRCPAGA